MSSLERLLLTFAIIGISLSSGYAVRHVLGKNAALRGWLDQLRQRLQAVAVFGLLPFAAMLSLWGLPAPGPRLLVLPALGVAAWLLGGILALLCSRWLRLDRRQTGSMYCCGTFANIGAVGSLVCVLFLGENSIALVALYRLCEELFYFSICFPVARWFGSPKLESWPRFHNMRPDPVLGVILLALGSGICLNLLGVPRPGLSNALASNAMILSTILFLFGIGLSLRVASLGAYMRPAAAICIIKFICVPLLITGLGAALGLGRLEHGLPLQVVAVLSSMPVAMTALVPPSLFNLNLDLANACWICSTAALILTLPVLLYLLHFL